MVGVGVGKCFSVLWIWRLGQKVMCKKEVANWCIPWCYKVAAQRRVVLSTVLFFCSAVA